MLAASALMLGACPSQDDSAGADTPSQQNSAPNIWGSPDSAVLTGNEYSFIPSASDADGDSIEFSITNKPRWASFDSATGQLSGRPLPGDEGVYAQVSIGASDGTASSALPDFSIEVTATALGSMSLTWTAPTQNSDGTALSDLAGFNLYHGTTAGNYTHKIRIDNPSISTYLIENLLPDTYYVVATSFNSSGVESDYSNMAVKTVEAQ